MTLSQEYLNAVSTMILYGQNGNITVFNYYNNTSTTYSTNPPTAVVAILKSNGNIVAKLQGFQTSISTTSVTFLFYDISNNTYTFDEVDIYTENNGTLVYLVSQNTGLNYTKNKDEVVAIYFTLSISGSINEYITYSFFYILVPNLTQQGVFTVSNYVGIYNAAVSGVSGTVTLKGRGLISNGFVIYADLTTTGGGTPTIIARTVYVTNPSTLTLNFPTVFTAQLNTSLPSTSSPTTYPIKFGLTYQVST